MKHKVSAGILIFMGLLHAGSISEEKAAALSTLKKHAQTVACETSFEAKDYRMGTYMKNVFPIERDPETGSATYYILWYGDMGCMGGSGTASFVISNVSRNSASRPFLVLNNEAFGKDFSDKINTKYLESLQQMSPDKFVVISSELGEDDPLCCPSQRYKTLIQFQNYMWKVVEKKLMKK